MSENKLETPQDIDTPNRSRRSLKVRLTSLENIITYILPMLVGMVFIIVVLVVVVAKTAEPRIEQLFFYINNDGIAVAQRDADAVPTVSMTQNFIQGCIRKTYTLSSASWSDEIDEARYCFNQISFNSFHNDSESMINDIFLRSNSRGITTAQNISSKFLYDAVTSTGGACSLKTVEQFEHVTDCRVFNVKFDQHIKYLDASGTQLGTISRDFNIWMFIVPRSMSLNGMYIYQIFDNSN